MTSGDAGLIVEQFRTAKIRLPESEIPFLISTF
jgi:hypothetical protein